ncbi:unnamed protein product [Hymenolepis diminuta]|uniref:Uncharacterized protein n=1 Tax=Hymenolepis diminuta TaxID=6216 RepID=A0A0R3SFE6_HYMDI|nr:unnamed protein product [Hymenolepis diminuta]
MANNVKAQQIIDLLNHPDNIRPTLVHPGNTSLKRNSRIRFAEPKFEEIRRQNFRTFGEEAHLFAERGKVDHLREQYHGYHGISQRHQNLSTRNSQSLPRNISSPMARILQPDFLLTPRTVKPSSPCLLGEGLENWRRGRGTLSLQYSTQQRLPSSNTPSHDSRFNYRTDEFRENLWKDRYRRSSIFDYNSSSSINQQNNIRSRVSEEGREISQRGRGLTNDGMNSILNQGWSERSGIRRAQSAVDIRRSKASTPYSSVDSVSSLWNSKPEVVKKKPQLAGPYLYETSPEVEQRNRQGVAEALDYSKNSGMKRQQLPQRVQYEGLENARKARESDLFGKASPNLPIARIRPEAQEIADSRHGDGVKHLITSNNLEAPPPPIRKLDPSGRRIAKISQGGAAKACLNPPRPKQKPLRVVRY